MSANWKTQQWPQDWKRSVFIPVPMKGNAKECSNYHTIAFILHASKVVQRVDSLEKTLMLGGTGDWRRRDDRGWDVWMASPTQWTWVWVNSWSWWWTGRPGVLLFMGSQRVGHGWATELNWRLWSKSFNSTWTGNFQIYKLGLEKAEELEIKLPTFIWS